MLSLFISFRVNNFVSPLTAEEKKENQLKGNLIMTVKNRPLRNLKDEARQRKWKAGPCPLHLSLQAVTFTVPPLGKIIRNYKG